MEDTVVKQLFFSPRRYGRFSLHSVRCDACAVRLNIAFFHVFWFPTDGIPIRQRALFGQQIGSPKREHSKTFQNVRREKGTPNLSIPLSQGKPGQAKPSRAESTGINRPALYTLTPDRPPLAACTGMQIVSSVESSHPQRVTQRQDPDSPAKIAMSASFSLEHS